MDKNGNTQAMILARKGKKIPVELYHDPTITDKERMTVAMIFAFWW